MLRIRSTAISANLRRLSIQPVRPFGTTSSAVSLPSCSTSFAATKVVNVRRMPMYTRRTFDCNVSLSALGSQPIGLWSSARGVRTRGKGEGEAANEEAKTEATEEKKTEGEAAEGEAKGKKDGEAKKEGKAEEEEPKKSFVQQVLGIKDDIKAFPEIYNAPNMLNMLLFTIFCLATTGSNVEGDWWVNQWGIDASFQPWTWFLHGFMMNNFTSMAFAMMLVNSLCHGVLPTLGNRGLMMYCGITTVVAGMAMWGLNAAMGNRAEKQFGPWDSLSALFVMQYLHQGITPWATLSAFNGWIRYAAYVGAVCILYYDWQPVVFGTAIGYALCLTRFKAPVPVK